MKRSTHSALDVTKLKAGGWTVSTGGTGKVYPTKVAAMKAARTIAREQGGVLTIRHANGGVGKSFTLGRAAMTKLNAVEGVVLGHAARQVFTTFDRADATPAQRRAALAGLPDHRADLDGGGEKRSRLQMVGAHDLPQRTRLAAGAKIEELPADEAFEPDGPRHHGDRLQPRLRREARRRGDECIGMAQHGDGRQDRRVLTMGAMDGGAPPAHVRVVHAGQIVEDQGGGVDELDGAADVESGLALAAEILGDEHRHQGAETLAGRERPVRDRGRQGLHALAGRRHQLRQPKLDAAAGRVERGCRPACHPQWFGPILRKAPNMSSLAGRGYVFSPTARA